MNPTLIENESSIRNPILSVLSDISTGAYVSNVPESKSLVKHFAFTRSNNIRALVDNAWEERHRLHPSFRFIKSPGPPSTFRDMIIKKAFDALTTEELEKLTEEVKLERQMKTIEHYRDIREKYGTINMEQYVRSAPPILTIYGAYSRSTDLTVDILRSITNAVEAITGLKTILWVGGSINGGIGLIQYIFTFMP